MSQQSQQPTSERAVEGQLGEGSRGPTPMSFNDTNIIAPTPRYFMTPAMLEAIPQRRGPSARLVEEFAALYPNEQRTGRRFHQWEYDIRAPNRSVEDRERYRGTHVDVVARHGGAEREQDYVWSSHDSGTPEGYERYVFPDNRRSYYLARPGLPPPTEETPGFWTQHVDMRRAYQHLQSDYNRLRERMVVAQREVAEAREGRLTAETTRDTLMRRMEEAQKASDATAITRGNENHKLQIELSGMKTALHNSERRAIELEKLNHTYDARIKHLEQVVASQVPPPSHPPRPRTAKPTDKGKGRADPKQRDIRDWAKRVPSAGPSGQNPAHQANPEQPAGQIQMPPISPAESYQGDDQDDEFKDLHFAFPPDKGAPAPDRARRSPAPPPASSDEVHRQSFRGPKVNLPEPFDGTKAKARIWFTDVMNYITMKPSEFGDEQAKIRWAISYIRGDNVNHWKASLFERMDSGEVVYPTLQDFAKEFRRMYYPANPELEGQRMLRSLQQRYKPWEEFITEWEHWVKVSGYKDEQLLLQFLRNAMRKELCDRVWASEGISRDVNSYALWKDVAARLDLQQQQQWASNYNSEDRKGKGKKSDSKNRQVTAGQGSTKAPETANAVRTQRSPVKNVDEAGRSVPHKDTVGVENERDKLRKCGACGKLRNEGGSCTDIWHTHYYDTKAQCWKPKTSSQPAGTVARVITAEDAETVRAFKAAVAANPALLGSAGFQYGKA